MAGGKRKFNRGIKLYEALMFLPNKARPKKLTQLPGDGKWLWDYTNIRNKVYLDADGAFTDGWNRPSHAEPCGSTGCMLGMAEALNIIDDAESYTLAEALGLGEQEVHYLAYGDAFDKPMKDVTPHQVGRKLKKLLAARYPKHMLAYEEERALA